MTTLAAAAAMTTPVAFEYRDAESAAATSAREQSYGVIFVETAWEVPLVRRILELERLPPDWDGYGSPPVGREMASRAIWLVSQIAGLGIETLPAPFVGPVAGGGVILEWTVRSRQLSIAVLAERKIEYLKWETGEQFEEGEVSLRSLGRLRELISWLTRPV
jgi:hypothetical protein